MGVLCDWLCAGNQMRHYIIAAFSQSLCPKRVSRKRSHISPFFQVSPTRVFTVQFHLRIMMRHSKLSVGSLLSTLLTVTTSFALNIPMDHPAIISLDSPTTYSTLTTNHYHVQCTRITDPPQPGLQPTHCGFAIRNVCAKLHPEYLRPPPSPRDQWVWSDPLPGCSVGWFLPETSPEPGGMCLATLWAIFNECATDSRFNAGVVNVGVLPSASGSGTGVEASAARYIMAPQQLSENTSCLDEMKSEGVC